MTRPLSRFALDRFARRGRRRARIAAAFSGEVGLPATAAMIAFADGDHAGRVAGPRPVRGIAHRFGGSHALRDIIDLTLVEAAIRSGDGALARALAAERAALRHESPLGHLFLRRAAALAA